RSGGEGVDFRRVVDADLGHRDARRFGLPLHGGEQPGLAFVARLGDQVQAGGALGHPLGHGQGNEGATEAEYRGEQQQGAVVAQGDAEDVLQHAHDDAEQDQHRQVGGKEQGDSLEHGGFSRGGGGGAAVLGLNVRSDG